MVILSLSETAATTVITPWGKEEGIIYQDVAYLPAQTHKSLQEAIAACRRELDSGLIAIVVQERDAVKLWCPVPQELQSSPRLGKAMNHANL